MMIIKDPTLEDIMYEDLDQDTLDVLVKLAKDIELDDNDVELIKGSRSLADIASMTFNELSADGEFIILNKQYGKILSVSICVFAMHLYKKGISGVMLGGDFVTLSDIATSISYNVNGDALTRLYTFFKGIFASIESYPSHIVEQSIMKAGGSTWYIFGYDKNEFILYTHDLTKRLPN